MVHCAAYTAVDAAEDNVEICRKVNADGTQNIANVCKKLDCKMVYISTDYAVSYTHLVLLLLVIYFILCRKYQKRIIELQENAHPGWNWWKLRKQVTELEDKKAEGIGEDIRRAAQSYMTV